VAGGADQKRDRPTSVRALNPINLVA
jgi:hypothetical protein